MVYMWWRNLLERSKTKRITDLLQAISNDELCCFVYLIFADIVVILLHIGFALESELSWSNVSLSELLCGIYTLAGFAVMSSCVPNRVIQYLAMKQKLQLKSNHTAIRYISHEIRSPMNIVQNGVRLAKDDLRTGCRISEVLDTLADVEHASVTASSILDDLLHFEKIENGNFAIEPKLQMARPYLMQTCNDCRILAEQKNIRFSVEDRLPPSGLSSGVELGILVDIVRFEQVIRNLIVNAVKFTPAGGFIAIVLRCTAQSTEIKTCRKQPSLNSTSENFFCKVHCETQVQNFPPPYLEGSENPQKIVIDVIDNGAGLSKLQLNQVFGQFVQFNANCLQGGGQWAWFVDL